MKCCNLIFNDDGLPVYMKFPFIVLVTTSIWLIVTFITPADEKETLIKIGNKSHIDLSDIRINLKGKK